MTKIFITGVASLLVAPAVVHYANLMPIKAPPPDPLVICYGDIATAYMGDVTKDLVREAVYWLSYNDRLFKVTDAIPRVQGISPDF